MFRIGISKWMPAAYLGEVKGDDFIMKDGSLPVSMFKELIMPLHEPNAPIGTKGIGFANSDIFGDLGYMGEIISLEEYTEGREYMAAYIDKKAMLFKTLQGRKFQINLFIPYIP